MNTFEILIKEYKESSWKKYVSYFGQVNVRVSGIPNDIVTVIISLLGEEAGTNWLTSSNNLFDDKSINDLLQSKIVSSKL